MMKKKEFDENVLISLGQIPIISDRVLAAEDLEIGGELENAPYDGSVVFVLDNTMAKFFDKNINFKILDVTSNTYLFPSDEPTVSSSTTTAMLSKGLMSYYLSGKVFEKSIKDERFFNIRVPNGRKVSFHVNVKEGSRIKFTSSIDSKDIKISVIYQMDVTKTLKLIRDGATILNKKQSSRLTDLRSQLEKNQSEKKELEAILIEERSEQKNKITELKDEIDRLNHQICEIIDVNQKKHDTHTKRLKDMLIKAEEAQKNEMETLRREHENEMNEKLKTALEKLENSKQEHELELKTTIEAHHEKLRKLQMDHDSSIQSLEECVKNLRLQLKQKEEDVCDMKENDSKRLKEYYEKKISDLKDLNLKQRVALGAVAAATMATKVKDLQDRNDSLVQKLTDLESQNENLENKYRELSQSHCMVRLERNVLRQESVSSISSSKSSDSSLWQRAGVQKRIVLCVNCDLPSSTALLSQGINVVYLDNEKILSEYLDSAPTRILLRCPDTSVRILVHDVRVAGVIRDLGVDCPILVLSKQIITPDLLNVNATKDMKAIMDFSSFEDSMFMFMELEESKKVFTSSSSPIRDRAIDYTRRQVGIRKWKRCLQSLRNMGFVDDDASLRAIEENYKRYPSSTIAQRVSAVAAYLSGAQK